MDNLEVTMLKQRIADMQLGINMLLNQIRNVISDLEENEDPLEAAAALKGLIGD